MASKLSRLSLADLLPLALLDARSVLPGTAEVALMHSRIDTRCYLHRRLIRAARHLPVVLAAVVLTISLAAAAAAYAEPREGYRLGPEDTIAVKVLGHGEFSGEYLVPSDGQVRVPVVGAVDVRSRTTEEVATCVRDGLRNRLRNPEVTVSLKVPRPQRIYVMGAVKAPGSFDSKPGWRITEALAAAGGLLPRTEAADCTVTIERSSTGKRETACLGDLLRTSPEKNAPVESGDVITIDPGAPVGVYVLGRVKNPGLCKLRKTQAGIMEAIALAGGALDDASIAHVSVKRVNGETETVDLSSAARDGRQVKDVVLRSGDLIIVPLNSSRFSVLGFVAQPGLYNLKAGQRVTLSDALGMAKGVGNRRGKRSSVAIVRTEGGREQRIVCDHERFVREGDASQNPEIRAGDVIYVPETSKFDWETILRAASATGIALSPLVR